MKKLLIIMNPCSEYIPLVDLEIRPVILNLVISSSGKFIKIWNIFSRVLKAALDETLVERKEVV